MDLHLAFRSNRTLKTGPSFIKSNPISLLIGVTRRKNKEKAERERERETEREKRERGECGLGCVPSYCVLI